MKKLLPPSLLLLSILFSISSNAQINFGDFEYSSAFGETCTNTQKDYLNANSDVIFIMSNAIYNQFSKHNKLSDYVHNEYYLTNSYFLTYFNSGVGDFTRHQEATETFKYIKNTVWDKDFEIRCVPAHYSQPNAEASAVRPTVDNNLMKAVILYDKFWDKLALNSTDVARLYMGGIMMHELAHVSSFSITDMNGYGLNNLLNLTPQESLESPEAYRISAQAYYDEN